MNKITEYFLAYSSGMSYFLKEVQDMINEGWQPYGELKVSHGIFYQAMVKYEVTTPQSSQLDYIPPFSSSNSSALPVSNKQG